jgi:mono/diheme cytochrome c family protein
MIKFTSWFLAALAFTVTGCTNNPVTPDPDEDPIACDTAAVSLSADIRPFLNTKCVSCHGSVLQSGGYNLADHTGIMVAVNNGRLLGSVRHEQGFSAMPSGSAKLEDCQIAKLESWVAQGALDN